MKTVTGRRIWMCAAGALRTAAAIGVCCVCAVLFICAAEANNLMVSNGGVYAQDTTNHVLVIQFNISWDNSWSDNVNHDAIWIFLKYTLYDSPTIYNAQWHHATLYAGEAPTNLPNTRTNPTGYSSGSGTLVDIVVAADGKGCFIRRNGYGTGTVNTTGIRVVWNYGADGLTDAEAVASMTSIKIFGIEMVAVPSPVGYIGDGTNREGGTTNHFFDAGDGTDPRNAVYYSGGTKYISSSNWGDAMVGDITWVNENYFGGTLPASRVEINTAYPPFGSGFYLMKYELTQEQYKDFLNCLTAAEQMNRVSAQTAGNYMWWQDGASTPEQRNGIKCKTAPAAGAKGEYGCDLDNDDIYEEDGDGQNIACNWFSIADVMAYADWAALRVPTEIEYELAARGVQGNVFEEYAWGTTSSTAAQAIGDAGMSTEHVDTAGANACYGNYSDIGPLRVGLFATAATTRTQAGASYYGAMELSGNLAEGYVSLDPTYGITYRGTHGDGVLETAAGYEGNATNSDWPGYVAGQGVHQATPGIGIRGGGFSDTTDAMRISDRSVASIPVVGESSREGGHVGARYARSESM